MSRARPMRDRDRRHGLPIPRRGGPLRLLGEHPRGQGLHRRRAGRPMGSSTFVDPSSETNDRVPCGRGGYLDSPIAFDAAAHGIMPRTVEGGEPEQFLVLDATTAALDDAGLTPAELKGRRVEVVIGRGNYFNRGNLTRLQHGRIAAQTVAILSALHPEWSEADREAVRAELKAGCRRSRRPRSPDS